MAAQDQSIQNEARHAVFVNRFAGGLSQEFLPFLDRIKKEVNNELMSAQTELSGRRLRKLVRDIADIQRGIYTDYSQELFEQLELFNTNEIDFEIDSLDDVIISDTVDLVRPANTQVWAAVNTNPLIFPDSNDTVLLKPFVKNWTNQEIRRVSNIITTGFITGETNQQIAQKITGKGGTLDKQTRANNKTIVRTATNHVSTVARSRTMQENDDIVIGYEWVSALDDRTSTQCRSLDGKIFKFKSTGYKPKPPIHPNCRSTTAPVLDKRFDLDDGTELRAAKGAEGGQQVKATTSYYSFLKGQPKAFQNDVLGPTRGALLRNGGLTADEFARLSVDQRFRPLTLAEMEKKNPLAFEKANLD